jgi:hypothetical protein
MIVQNVPNAAKPSWNASISVEGGRARAHCDKFQGQTLQHQSRKRIHRAELVIHPLRDP